MSKRAAVAGCVLALSAVTAAQGPRYPVPPPLLDAPIAGARAQVADLMKAKRIPGLSVAVARTGEVVWSEGFGFADLEQGVPVTTLTRFRLGSVSKVLTVAGVARLVEDGALDLDAPVQRYVPHFPVKPWPVTTRQLTGHLSGIRHYADADFTGPLSLPRHYPTLAAAVALFQDAPLQFQPGTQYGYSTYGFTLVSAVVAGASHQEFLTFMQRAVFDRLGLRYTGADHPDAIVAHRTAFYELPEGGAVRNAPRVDSSYKWAGGGLLSTAEDIARFGSAHLQPGFLRQQTLDLLFTSQRLADGTETGVGIGWRSGKDARGRRILHHGGTIDGGRAMLMMFPESGVVVAMLSNMLARFGEEDAIALGERFIP